MQRKNPRQHTHNWQMRITKVSKFSAVPDYLEYLKKYSPGGFYMQRHWACVRGGKVKHVLARKKEYRQDIFVAMSGNPDLVSYG